MTHEVAAMNNQELMANIVTVTEILARTDISTYARTALEKLLTELSFEIAKRATAA